MKRLVFIAVILLTRLVLGHDLPAQLPAPDSVPEAWNVIEESAANVDKLLEGGLLRDVTFQIANVGSALQLLDARAAESKDPPKIKQLTSTLLADGAAIIVAIRDRTEPLETTKSKWIAWRKKLGELESLYAPQMLHAAVYICSMHPLDRHLSADDKCTKCGMTLIRRHLPASSVYEKPGEPTMTAQVVASPLIVGKSGEVRIRLAKRDGSPVQLADLLEVHTQKIHLLLNDTSLSDYHHEHPKPTEIPGEYLFTFTPRKPGPYRTWADLVPATSGIQEYVIVDIPAETAPEPLTNHEIVTTATVDGRTYKLSLNTAGQPIHAGQTVIGTIEITSSDGKPFANLEPVMGTFAHMVGFSEDHKTVIHIHPYGQSSTRPKDRGGPAFAFKLYVPTPGFLRLYAQVQIDGTAQFAPFGLTISPAQPAQNQP